MRKEFTRLELYELVWSKPVTTIAEELNVNSYVLRKICKDNDIPIPSFGYWPKIKWGKVAIKAQLPESTKRTNKLLVIEGVDAKPVSTNEDVNQVVSNKKLKLKVPATLSNPEKLILDTKVFYENERNRHDDSLYDKKIAQYNHLSIHVSKSLMPRALKIFDILIKNLKLLGYRIDFKYYDTIIRSEDDIEVKVSMREKSTSSYSTDKWGWRNRKLTLNGLLCLKIGENWDCTEYSDTENVKLEEKILKILAKIEAIVLKEREWKVKRDIAEKERERKEEIARLIQKAKDDEYNKFKDFYNSAHRWKEYMILKEYYEMVEAASQGNETPELSDWLAWAKEKLDWYNPTMSINSDLLDDVDKETIEYKNKIKQPFWRS